MDFCFVDNTATIDPHSRKRIRSHVMKGRNLGKVMPRRRRTAAAARPLIPRDNTRAVEIRPGDPFEEYDDTGPLFPEVAETNLVGRVTPPPSNLFSGTEFSYFASPAYFTPSARYLIYQCKNRPLGCLLVPAISS